MQGHSVLSTHEVTNQSPDLSHLDLLYGDLALMDAITANGGDWALPEISAMAEKLGDPDMVEAGRLANRHLPELQIFDRRGHRVDRVEFHPSYHKLMALGFDNGVHTFPFQQRDAGSHVAHAAMLYMFYQVEVGVCCPILMNYAIIPVLEKHPYLPPIWLEKVMANRYDPRFLPIEQKEGATFGMAMTEKQGGSDVRANSTIAEPIGERGPGKPYELRGHKWFCSAPMSDAFLTLANTGDKGISCFLVPRFKPDGEQNRMHVQRLKDKLGNRSNASSEIEYDGAWALLVGEEGRGIATIMAMVHHTRQDVAITPAALMRISLVHAIHHARNRRAFQKRLIDQPLMRNVLAHLAVESEAATALAIYGAATFDRSRENERGKILSRVVAAICKYWLNKRAGQFVNEALECLGGAGYVEENDLARFYREVPLHGIWEGCGNVVALDVLRTLSRFPETAAIMIEELRGMAQGNSTYDAAVAELEDWMQNQPLLESAARRLTEKLAVTFQAGLLLRDAPNAVAQAFCAANLEAGGSGRDFGTLEDSADIDAILERCLPERAAA